MFVGESTMKAFEFDHRLIDSYARFSRSFSTIRSDDLKSEIDRQYDAGRFWPDALLSLNPRYLQGATVDDLVASGDLDEATGLIFVSRRTVPRVRDTCWRAASADMPLEINAAVTRLETPGPLSSSSCSIESRKGPPTA